MKKTLHLTLLSFLFFIFSCSQDDITESTSSESKKESTLLHKNATFLEGNNKINSILDQLNSVKQFRSVNDSLDKVNFKVYKDNITYIKTPDGERESFTFFVEKNYKRNLNFVENLVISKNKNSDKFEGVLITYYFPDGYKVENKDFQVIETVPIPDIEKFDLFNKNDNRSARSSGCQVDLVETKHSCYSGHHSGAGESGQCDHKGQGPYSTFTLYLSCSGSGGDGGGQESSPGGNNGPQTGNGGPRGNNGNSGANDGIDTGMTFPPCERDNCEDKLDIILKDLSDRLTQNPYLLLNIPHNQFDAWMKLNNYKVPQSVKNRINALNLNEGKKAYYLHDINEAEGPILNMDFFSVTISQLPKKFPSNERYTASEFFEDMMRKQLNNFLIGGPASFEAYNEIERQKWNSKNYLGTIMRFNIKAALWGLITQDGSVIAIDQSPTRWIFSTIRTPKDYDHPVSGFREFGYYKNGENYVFYTRGIDRVTLKSDYFVGEYGPFQNTFEGADKLWTTFQNNLVNHINSPVNGGKAKINNPYKSRPDWKQYQKVIKGEAPINTLPGFNIK